MQCLINMDAADYSIALPATGTLDVLVRMLTKDPLTNVAAIVQVCSTLKPEQERIRSVRLETTAEFAETIRGYLWLLPLPVTVVIV